jgi:SAM-dependent methyltransferase
MASSEEGLSRIKEISSAYWQSQVLFVALRLGVFRELQGVPLPPEDLAVRLGLSPAGLEPLLTALEALGLLYRSGKAFGVEETLRPHLAQGAETDFRAGAAHMDHLQASWLNLEASVRTGRSPETDEDLSEAESRQQTEHFMEAMESFGALTSQELVHQFPLVGNEAILDLGCGPGTYFRGFLRRYPAVRATAVDREDVIPITRRCVARDGLGARVTYLSGDFRELDLAEEKWHVVLLSNVMHIYPPDEVLSICRRIYSLLRAGGHLLVSDFFTDESGTRPVWGALFCLNMLLHTEGGRNYRLRDGEAFLREAGFAGIRSEYLCLDSTLLIGTRPR